MQVATPAQMKRMAVKLRAKNSATDSIYLMAIYLLNLINFHISIATDTGKYVSFLMY